MGVIGWLVAIGSILIGAAVGLWGLTEVNKSFVIWLCGVPGAFCLVTAAGLELQSIAGVKDTKIPAGVSLEQRPWINVTAFSGGPLAYDNQGGRVGLIVDVKNAGQTPAINVTLNAFVYLVGKDHMDVLGEQKKFCETIKRRPAISGETIFKDGTARLDNSLPIPKADIDEFSFTASLPTGAKRFMMPVIIGCIDYKSTFEADHYQTGFALNVSGGTKPPTTVRITLPSGSSAAIPPPTDSDAFVISPDGGNIPAGRVQLSRWIGGGFFAD